MKLEQAARLALEALEEWKSEYNCNDDDKAIAALREALAEQVEQEPVAVDVYEKQLGIPTAPIAGHYSVNGETIFLEKGEPMVTYKQAEQEPVVCKHEWFRTGAMEIGESRCIHCGKWNHSAPVRTKDLTEKEITDLFRVASDHIEFARAVIAADRGKNK